MVIHQATKKAFTTRQHINAAMIEYFDSFNNQVTNMEACGGMILDLGVINYMVKKAHHKKWSIHPANENL